MPDLTEDMLQPDVPFTFETYKEWTAALKSLKFKHFRATSMRDFNEVAKLAQRILIQLPPIYQAKLPTYLLARCPICQGRVTEPIDTFSLSGMGWWISEPLGFGWFGRRIKQVYEAIRPLAYDRYPEPSYQAECSHVRAMTYGVNLNGIIPDDVKPLSWLVIGSERPGVLKPFMELAGSYAVIHHLPVGRLDDATWQPRYTAYFVTYFNQNANSFRQCLAPRDWYHWEFLWPYEWMDYDLAPWLEKGKLFWLGPELEGYPLRQEPAADFPYARMEGLVGRWAANRERGARLLPPANGILLDNPQFKAFRQVEWVEAEALQKRNFRWLKSGEPLAIDPSLVYSQAAVQGQGPSAKISRLTPVTQSWTPETDQEALAHYYRAEAYHQQKQWDQVIADIEALIRLLPPGETDHPVELPDGSDLKMFLAKSYYLLGLACFEKKEYGKAVKVYTTAISLKPDYWEAYFERAIASEFGGSYSRAVRDYDTVLKLNPHFALAYYNRGTMHFRLHEHEQAVADYLQAIDLNPQDAYAHFNLGVVYARLDRLKGTYAQQAIESYTRAIELDPQNAEAYYNRGHLYMIKRQYDNQLAIADFKKAAELGDQKAKNMLKKLPPSIEG